MYYIGVDLGTSSLKLLFVSIILPIIIPEQVRTILLKFIFKLFKNFFSSFLKFVLVFLKFPKS